MQPPPFFEDIKAHSQAFLDRHGLDKAPLQRFLSSFDESLDKVLNISPLKDVEKNAKAWFESAIAQAMAHVNLVQREEMDNHLRVMEGMAEKISALEARVRALELTTSTNLSSPQPGSLPD